MNEKKGKWINVHQYLTTLPMSSLFSVRICSSEDYKMYSVEFCSSVIQKRPFKTDNHITDWTTKTSSESLRGWFKLWPFPESNSVFLLVSRVLQRGYPLMLRGWITSWPLPLLILPVKHERREMISWYHANNMAAFKCSMNIIIHTCYFYRMTTFNTCKGPNDSHIHNQIIIIKKGKGKITHLLLKIIHHRSCETLRTQTLNGLGPIWTLIWHLTLNVPQIRLTGRSISQSASGRRDPVRH